MWSFRPGGMFALVPVIVAGLCATPARQAAIPAQFQGEWNENLEHCGTGINHARFRIGPDWIRFYESGGPVRAVVTEGELEVAVIARLSGEGMSYLSALHFRLSPDQARLEQLGIGGASVVRHRCPREEGTRGGWSPLSRPAAG